VPSSPVALGGTSFGLPSAFVTACLPVRECSRGMIRRVCLLAVAVLAVITCGAVRAQSELGIKGYLSDKYCWDLPGSVALDGARMRTNPERHTVHCMRDVARCRESGFMILRQVAQVCGNGWCDISADGDYEPVYQLDAAGNEQALALLDSTTAVRDFQVVVVGTVADAGASLPTLAASSVTEAPGPQAPRLRGELPLFLHLLMMVCSWGALLPWGVAVASRTRGVADPAWFVSHRRLQVTGWALQLLGFCCAVWYCQVYSTHFASGHTKIGLTVVILGTLQPLNAYFRPHPLPQSEDSLLRRAVNGEPNAWKRLVFECLHKGGGWTAVSLGMLNVVIGVGLIHLKGYDGTTVGIALTGACLGTLCYCPTQTHQIDYVPRQSKHMCRPSLQRVLAPIVRRPCSSCAIFHRWHMSQRECVGNGMSALCWRRWKSSRST
jgi:hypothetical protein